MGGVMGDGEAKYNLHEQPIPIVLNHSNIFFSIALILTL